MFLLYCDETNLDPRENTFFVYGGISIPCDSAKGLHDKIEAIRESTSIPSDFCLKFNPKPPNLDHEEFIIIKEAIIEAASEFGCTFLVSIILHRVATSPEEARRKEINRVIYHFNCLMHRFDDYGLCLIDRFSDSQIDAHLREKFSIGLRGLPYSRTKRLDRIIGYHYSAIGQSHFNSLIDIVLGSFRFSINAHCAQDPDKIQTADILLPLLEPLFFREGTENKVSELSVNFSPKIIRSNAYRQLYTNLKQFLADRGIDSAQEITDIRRY